MARKRDPIVAVLQYFETAEVPLMLQALALVKDIARRRTPPAAKARRERKAKPAATTAASAAATDQPATEAFVGKRRRRPEPTDLALPGIGPTTIGD